MEKETVKIADKQAPVCRHLKQKTTEHTDEELRLEIFKTEVFPTILSCYVRISEQGSKIHGEKSQLQLCWSISDFLAWALLVSFDFDFLKAGFRIRSRSRSRSHKRAYDLVKIENWSRKQSHKFDGIGVGRIRTFPFLPIPFTTPSLMIQ